MSREIVDEELPSFEDVAQQSSLPPTPFEITLGDLATCSYVHFLILSFFLSAEFLPTHEPFRKYPVHDLLLSMTGFVEVFFGLLFVTALPRRKSFTAVYYFVLMIANCFVATLMNAMVNQYLGGFSAVWWLYWLTIIFCRIRSNLASELRSIFGRDYENFVKHLASLEVGMPLQGSKNTNQKTNKNSGRKRN